MFAGAANHSAATVLGADAESQFLDGREHDDAFRLFQKIVRNVVRDVEDFLHDDATLFEAFLLLVQILGIHYTGCEGETCCGY
jgi:hypothetical protein